MRKLHVCLKLVIVLLLFFEGFSLYPKWKLPKFKKKQIIAKIVGKSTGLKLGTNPVVYFAPDGKMRLLTYAWGGNTILCYSLPQGKFIFSVEREPGKPGFRLAKNFVVLDD
ncbi:MAG TPA: hypothetical protein ENG13_01940, partial [bacterium]|nr:hypothetical protein [bacterium]HEX67810.1 hypothetical protein [bacterium]